MIATAQTLVAAENHVRARSAGGIIRSSVQIYRQHFGTLFGAFFIANLPALAGMALAAAEDAHWLAYVKLLVGMALAFIATVPITVIISDVCLGHEPSVVRAYRRAFSRLLGTVLLALFFTSLMITVGLVLLVVPGVVFMLWFPFVMVVIVLERTSAIKAMKRSRELGRGHYLRNFGILLLLNLIAQMTAYVVGGILGAVLGMLGTPAALLMALGGVIGLLFGAIPAIGTILLYYDMRVRREAYDSVKLAEDLAR